MNEPSANGQEVWDWANRLSDRMSKMDEISRLSKQIHTAQNTCGSCTSWMTNGCPRETYDSRTGRKHGPSSMAVKCERFAMSASDAANLLQAEQKVAALTLQLQSKEIPHD